MLFIFNALLQNQPVFVITVLQYSDGIDWSEQAVAVVVEDPMMSRAYTSQGIGYSMRAHEVKLQADRQSFNRKAMSSFQKLVRLQAKVLKFICMLSMIWYVFKVKETIPNELFARNHL